MDQTDSEGLGLSLAIFLGALLGVLVLLAVPVWLAVRPEVYENPVLPRETPLLNGPIAGYQPVSPIPLALLKREPIVDPKTVAALNAKVAKPKLASAEKAEPQQHRPLRRTVQRGSTAPVAELEPERRQRSGFFLFDLFGG
jgi:hypothetical protein